MGACQALVSSFFFLLVAQRAAVRNRSGRPFQMNKIKVCEGKSIYVYFWPGKVLCKKRTIDSIFFSQE